MDEEELEYVQCILTHSSDEEEPKVNWLVWSDEEERSGGRAGHRRGREEVTLAELAPREEEEEEWRKKAPRMKISVERARAEEVEEEEQRCATTEQERSSGVPPKKWFGVQFAQEEVQRVVEEEQPPLAPTMRWVGLRTRVEVEEEEVIVNVELLESHGEKEERRRVGKKKKTSALLEEDNEEDHFDDTASRASTRAKRRGGNAPTQVSAREFFEAWGERKGRILISSLNVLSKERQAELVRLCENRYATRQQLEQHLDPNEIVLSKMGIRVTWLCCPDEEGDFVETSALFKHLRNGKTRCRICTKQGGGNSAVQVSSRVFFEAWGERNGCILITSLNALSEERQAQLVQMCGGRHATRPQLEPHFDKDEIVVSGTHCRVKWLCCPDERGDLVKTSAILNSLRAGYGRCRICNKNNIAKRKRK